MWLVAVTLVGLSLLSSSQIRVEGARCSGSITPIHLTARAGTISTPNFPHAFETPYCERWIVDAGAFDPSEPKYIHIYYTQPYFNDPPNFRVNFHEDLPFNSTQSRRQQRANPYNNVVFRASSPTSTTGKPNPHPHYLDGPLLGASSKFPERERYMSLEVRIESLFNTHFRTRDFFLHDYGFNLTYEISKSPWLRPDRCGIYRCSAGGNCYASSDYKNFFCSCQEGRSGRNCQYSPICDPTQNINPCMNGGECETMAAGSASCYCEEGFDGQSCSIKNSTTIKVCPGPGCPSCEDVDMKKISDPSRGHLCSCHKDSGIAKGPKDWNNYEAVFSLSQSNDSIPLPNWNIATEPKGLIDSNLELKTDVEHKLTKLLLEAVPGLHHDLNAVSVVSFGPESKFEFRFFGPPTAYNETQLALEKLSGHEIYNGTVLQTFLGFRSFPPLRLENVKMKPWRGEKYPIKEYENFSITCSAIGSNLTFKWFKDNINIDTSLSIYQGRIAEMQSDSESPLFRRSSTLNFDYALPSDRGTFTCQVSDIYGSQCQEFIMDVLSKPRIVVIPMSITVVKNTTDVAIRCSAPHDDTIDRMWHYDWKINGVLMNDNVYLNEVKEDQFPSGKLIKIKVAQTSKTYSCVVTNSAGEGSTDVRVEVLNSLSSPSCPKQFDRLGYEWKVTAPGQTAMQECPIEFIGYLQRKCEIKPGEINPYWGNTDFSNCVSQRLIAINASIQSAKSGFTTPMHLLEIVKSFKNYLTNRTYLNLGEGERIADVLRDLGHYAAAKGNKNDTIFFEDFLNTSTIFLSIPESCFRESSITLFIGSIYEMAAKYPLNGFAFQSNALIVEGPVMSLNSSLSFSTANNGYPDWLDFQLDIPPTPKKIPTSRFVLVIFRNLTIAVASTKRDVEHKLKLISPVVYINSSDYVFSQEKDIVLRFKVSKDWTELISRKEVDIACASLGEHLDQQMHYCNLTLFSTENGVVECSCDRFGKFGLVVSQNAIAREVDEISLHWPVLCGCIVCVICSSLSIVAILVYSHCQIQPDSIYLLKIVVCFSLIISILFILSMSVDASSVPLNTCLFSFVVLSLSCHLTKSLKIFRSHDGFGTSDPFKWLRFVPIVNLLLGFTFALVLPLWTSAAIMMHSHSELNGHSLLFIAFMVVLGILLIAFFFVFYKTIHHLRINRRSLDSIKIPIWDYRIKTLNRALAITISTVFTTLTAVLHSSARHSLVFQYLFGFSTSLLGILVLMSYTFKSEYPIPMFLTQRIPWISLPDFPDPEKSPSAKLSPAVGGIQNSRTPEKRYAPENGQVSAIMLQNHPPSSGSRNSSDPETMETWGGSVTSSSTTTKIRTDSFASSNTKRPSVGSRSSNTRSSRSRSNTNPLDFENNFQLEPREFPGRTEWFKSKVAQEFPPRMVKRPDHVTCLLDPSESSLIQLPPPKSNGTNGARVVSRHRSEDVGDYVGPSSNHVTKANGIHKRHEVQPSKHSVGFAPTSNGHPRRQLTTQVEIESPTPSPTTALLGNEHTQEVSTNNGSPRNPSSHFNRFN